MIDHVGFAVSDYVRSKRFYEQALKPLYHRMLGATSVFGAPRSSPAPAPSGSRTRDADRRTSGGS